MIAEVVNGLWSLLVEDFGQYSNKGCDADIIFLVYEQAFALTFSRS